MAEPKIRFKQDDGSDFPEWEEITFENLYESLNNNTFSRDFLNYEEGEVKNIHYGDILTKFSECCDVQNTLLPFCNEGCNVDKYVKLQDGDIIIADTAEDETVGKAIEIVNIQNDVVVSGLHTMACRPCMDFASGYLGYYMNSNAYHNQLRPYMQGIKVTSIGRKNIANTMIYYPSDMSEQKLIADFLSTVDEVIATSQEEVANLEKQKKAAMQKIFSQEVRFKKPDGSDFPEWEEKKLGEVTEFIRNGYSYKADGSRDYRYKITRIESISSGVINTDRLGSSEDINENYRLKNGDILFSHINSLRYIANTAIYTDDLGEIYHGMNLLNIRAKTQEIEPFFLLYLLKNEASRKWFRIVAKPAVNQASISTTEVGAFEFLMPNIEEQKLIADFFTSFDEAITAAKQELEKWKLLKKGLLQKMFV